MLQFQRLGLRFHTARVKSRLTRLPTATSGMRLQPDLSRHRIASLRLSPMADEDIHKPLLQRRRTPIRARRDAIGAVRQTKLRRCDPEHAELLLEQRLMSRQKRKPVARRDERTDEATRRSRNARRRSLLGAREQAFERQI